MLLCLLARAQPVQDSSVPAEIAASSSCPREPEPTPEPTVFSSDELAGYAALTMEDCDRLFGEPKINEEQTSVIRRYAEQGVTCIFARYRLADAPPEIYLKTIVTSASEPAILRGIRVGDSLSSVLAKFADEKADPYTAGSSETVRPLYGKYGETKQYAHLSIQGTWFSYLQLSDGHWFINITFKEKVVQYIRATKKEDFTPVPGMFLSDELQAQTTVPMEAFDAFFGTPVKEDVQFRHPDADETYDFEGVIREYSGAYCQFYYTHDKNTPVTTRLDHMRITSSDYAPVRDIRVGDSFAEAAAKFPQSDRIPYYESDYTVKILYGKYLHPEIYGCVLSYKDGSCALRFTTELHSIVFTFDSSGVLTEIRIGFSG